MTANAELTVVFDNLPPKAKSISVSITNAATLRQYSASSTIRGSSFTLSDIPGGTGNRHYIDLTVMDGTDRIVDIAYVVSDFPQRTNVLPLSLVSGVWRLSREVVIEEDRFDRLIVEPIIDEEKAALYHCSHEFYFVNNHGKKTDKGAFNYQVTDRESSFYGFKEIQLVNGSENPADMIVCNENLTNRDLYAGSLMDERVRQLLFGDKAYPYMVGKNHDWVETALLVTRSVPKREPVAQSAKVSQFKDLLKEFASRASYNKHLPQMPDKGEVILKDVPVIHFRKHCTGHYKLVPYRFDTVTFLLALYDISIQKVKAIKRTSSS